MFQFFSRPDLYLAPSGRFLPRVSEAELSSEALQGLKVLFASDFHLCANMDPAKIVDRMNACEADLILLGGDYADTAHEALRLFRAFRALRAPMGIFAVQGNNDTEAFPEPGKLRQALADFGAQLLVNERATLSFHGQSLHIAGLDESKYGEPAYEGLFPDDGAYRILLSHYPLLPAAEPDSLPDLMLSGHTHGGQFNFLGLNPYSIGFERIGAKSYAPALVSGVRRFGRTTLLVSKGIGASRIPLRVGVQPEIHRITFCAPSGNC